MNKRALPVFLVASCLAASAAAQSTDFMLAAQTTRPTPGRPTWPRPRSAAALPVVDFDMGSSAIRNEDKAVLDHASRAYNEGKPIVMILTGTGTAPHRKSAQPRPFSSAARLRC